MMFPVVPKSSNVFVPPAKSTRVLLKLLTKKMLPPPPPRTDWPPDAPPRTAVGYDQIAVRPGKIRRRDVVGRGRRGELPADDRCNALCFSRISSAVIVCEEQAVFAITASHRNCRHLKSPAPLIIPL
jgi:hypothetical protein